MSGDVVCCPVPSDVQLCDVWCRRVTSTTWWFAPDLLRADAILGARSLVMKGARCRYEAEFSPDCLSFRGRGDSSVGERTDYLKAPAAQVAKPGGSHGERRG
jgi:hypothetical protein